MITMKSPYRAKTGQKTAVVLPRGPMNRQTASAMVNEYRNVFIEDGKGARFRLVIRDARGGLVWQAWNDEANAGLAFATYISEYGVRR